MKTMPPAAGSASTRSNRSSPDSRYGGVTGEGDPEIIEPLATPLAADVSRWLWRSTQIGALSGQSPHGRKENDDRGHE